MDEKYIYKYVEHISIIVTGIIGFFIFWYLFIKYIESSEEPNDIFVALIGSVITTAFSSFIIISVHNLIKIQKYHQKKILPSKINIKKLAQQISFIVAGLIAFVVFWYMLDSGSGSEWEFAIACILTICCAFFVISLKNLIMKKQPYNHKLLSSILKILKKKSTISNYHTIPPNKDKLFLFLYLAGAIISLIVIKLIIISQKSKDTIPAAVLTVVKGEVKPVLDDSKQIF